MSYFPAIYFGGSTKHESLPEITQYEPESAMLEFSSWQDLFQTLSQYASNSWAFRGQSSYEWNLVTSFERVLRNRNLSNAIDEIRAWEAASITHFMEFSKPFLDDAPEIDDYLGWLFKMQHYGAPTRLLDWTFSPFVGLFFAYESQVYNSCGLPEDACLWLINFQNCLKVHNAQNYSLRGYSVEGTASLAHLVRDRHWAERQNKIADMVSSTGQPFPLPVVASSPDPRMIAQHAAFTFHGSTSTLNIDPTVSLWDLPPECEVPDIVEKPALTLRKIRLRSEWRDIVLQMLSRMNIHAQSLFPGLDGAGKATKLYLESLKQRPGVTKMLRVAEPFTLVDAPN